MIADNASSIAYKFKGFEAGDSSGFCPGDIARQQLATPNPSFGVDTGD